MREVGVGETGDAEDDGVEKLVSILPGGGARRLLMALCGMWLCKYGKGVVVVEEVDEEEVLEDEVAALDRVVCGGSTDE